MRKELGYFLQKCRDERVIASIIKKSDHKDLVILFQYLSIAEIKTKTRWLSMYEKNTRSIWNKIVTKT